jgi:hypothetical protein
MSLGNVLNMARTAMAAHQTALQVASQNISNATTEGYSRQRVELTTALPTVFPYGSVGTGVKIAGVTQARDTLLDAGVSSGIVWRIRGRHDEHRALADPVDPRRAERYWIERGAGCVLVGVE